MEALYLAHQTEPENEFVKLALQSGIDNVTIIDYRTPSDALRYFKDGANEFNLEASKLPFLELYHLVPEIEEAYKEHKKGQQARMCCGRIYTISSQTSQSGG